MVKEVIIISTITIMLLVIAFGVSYILVSLDTTEVPKGSCNIAIGKHAGERWTDESLQFVFTLPSSILDGYGNPDGYYEYSTTMTPNEYDMVRAVVKRAHKNFLFYDIPNGDK